MIAAEDEMTILSRPRVTVTAADPEVGIIAADIQRTIDEAERGSIVTIPKGTHYTGGIPITVLKEIELRGETGNPEDVILSNNTDTNRLLNVDAGPRALIHSMVLTGGKGGFNRTGDFANSSYALCAAVMVANRTGFYVSANNGRPSAGLGGCVSNVVVRSSWINGNYSDCSAVYLKGANALFTHSVISNCYSSSAQNAGVVKTIALGIYGGARGEHLLVTDNYSAVSGCALTSHVGGKGSVLRFSTITKNRCSWCGGVDVYNGGRFEYCDIAGNVATAAGEGDDKTDRRNVWTSYYEKDPRGNLTDENARPSWVDKKPSPQSYATEADQAAKEEIYSIQTNNAVDVADCLNEATVYATTAELKPIYRKGAWRLPKGSPAIDVVPAKDVSGMPEKDLNGNRRLVNALYDLGAFELPNPCGLMLLVK